MAWREDLGQRRRPLPPTLSASRPDLPAAYTAPPYETNELHERTPRISGAA
jgi:hypothetical protein